MSRSLGAINKIVCIVLERSTDDERTFPRRGQLLLAIRFLNSAEHQVALTKSEGADLLVVIVSQLLLVNCRSGQSHHANFFSQIDTVLSSFLGFCPSV